MDVSSPVILVVIVVVIDVTIDLVMLTLPSRYLELTGRDAGALGTFWPRFWVRFARAPVADVARPHALSVVNVGERLRVEYEQPPREPERQQIVMLKGCVCDIGDWLDGECFT